MSLYAATVPEGNPDESAATMGLEEGQSESWRELQREYIWGPSDNGFDELLVQYDGWGAPWWPIQDDGGDLVAMCDLGGESDEARVVGQWTYDAYGSVLTAEHLASFELPSLGHKGLFLDRLDGVEDSPRLIPFAHSIYHNRNRTYHPQWGRFIQRDPNLSAMPLLEATLSHGRGAGAMLQAFDMEGMYGDGMNLYAYLGSNPWTRSDPLGLSYDPFDMVDDYMAETAGNRAALLSQLGQNAKAVAVVTASIASYLPFPVVGNVGDMALYALGEMSGDEYASAMALGLVPGGKLLGKLGSFLGKVGSSAWSSAKHYASRAGGFLADKARGLAARARSWLDRKPKAACGCFTAATLVWTPAGAVPIDQIEQGSEVYAAPDDGQAASASPAEVGSTIIIGEASLLHLTLRHADGSVETLHTTDEHPFHVAASGEWTRADGLRPGDRLSTLAGEAEVLALSFSGERVPVYNLSIPGSPTYYVGQRGVWVHNCDFRPKKWRYTSRVEPGGNPKDPWGPNHNYPTSFDSDIIKNGSISEGMDGYVEFSLEGVLNGRNGQYEIGGRLGSDGVFEIEHRFFRKNK